MSEHLVIIKFYLNQRADKNIKADEQRALSCEMERQNLNYTRLDPFIIHKKIENYKARETTQHNVSERLVKLSVCACE